MPNDEYKKLWLHDEEDTVTVLPYTTLDNIKIDEGGGQFTDFQTNYEQLQRNVNSNKNKVTQLNNQLNSMNKVLYGVDDPVAGDDGDVYIQHGGGKIVKIWQKVNGEWYFFSNGGTPAITIGNVEVSKKPKINVSITIENYTGPPLS